ncbi:MAG TPA: hypothetical protein VLA72_22965 [Anaerolineales bacterium]|nr:hypothetical protein [Anaerolineales bacterium]
MFFVMFTMHNPDLLDELIREWETAGVQRATIVFSTGMRRLKRREAIRDDIPLMPSLEDFYEPSATFGRSVFTTVKDESMIDDILAATQRVVGDLSDHETGVLLVLPILKAYGLEKGDEVKK